MADKGFILTHRKIRDCVIWDSDEPFDRRSAWIDIIMMCNHSDKTILFDGEPVVVKRGQFLTSVRKLSEIWHWGKDKTLRYLRLLEQLEMIHRDSDTRRTLITVVNYEVYQAFVEEECDSDKDSNKSTPMDTHKPQTTIINNEQTMNNKNIYNVCFEEFWKIYPRKKEKAKAYAQYLARLNCGYSEEELLTACKNYADECNKTNKEERYIKLGATFLSVNEPFVDYLKKGESSSDRRMEESITGDIEQDRELEEYINSEEFLNDEYGNLF